MGSFGERLRREREMRGITLDEIAESTKISRRHLESLEKEDFDSLPGGIFNRGFVRSYARYLGIDEDQAVTDYAAAAAEPAEAENRFPIAVPEPDPELNPRRSGLPLILALLALVAVLAIFWARTRSRSTENAEAGAGTAAASTPGAARSPALPASNAVPNPTPGALPTVAGADPAATPPPAIAGRAASPNQGAVVVEPVASPGTAQSPERVFSVKVRAKEDAWVNLTADGKTMISRVLSAGEEQSFHAGKRIVFTTGNAGGVDVSFNGKGLGTIGNESEKRVLTFTPSGLVQ
jgi:cytoskeleton protein RodZ